MVAGLLPTDQVQHPVAAQRLAVVLDLDRGGLGCA
jgi:deoxyxylulose-5-phosphate synthase